MAGNGDRSDDDRGDKSVPNTMSATFHLDHVGEVAVLMDSDSLSWKSVRAGESKDCLGFASFVMTEVSFSNIYAADFINWGIIHEPIIPNSRAHFLSRGSKMYRFAVHGFQKSKAQNSPWVPVVHIFGNSDAETCLLWTERINASLSLQPGRPKNLLVFVHPLSGKGKGLRTWEGVAPIFCSAKVRTKVVVTERAGHAFDMMSSITFSELKSYDGVIAVGGDGFFSEILNGFLLSRHNAPYPPAPVEFKNSYGNTNNCPGEGVCNSSSSSFGPSLDQGQDQEPLLHIPEAMDSVHKDFRAKDGSCNLDRDATFSIPHEWFRFGIIPAGSTDAIVICTTGTRDAATSALQIVLGKRRHLDIAQVVRWKTTPLSTSTEAPSVRYAASFVGYGFYGDVIIESEKYRWMGPKRYDYAGTKVFLKHKSYEAEVAYVDVETVNPPAEKASTSGGTRQWWRLPKAQDRVTCSVKCPVCDAKTNSCSDTGDLKWLHCKGRFLSVGAAVISCRNERSPDGLVADAHLGDGFMHLILVKDCPHPLFLWHLTQLARKGGRPLNLDFVEHHKTTAFTFSSASSESTWNLDGESFPACQLSAQVFRGLISMFASGPDV